MERVVMPTSKHGSKSPVDDQRQLFAQQKHQDVASLDLTLTIWGRSDLKARGINFSDAWLLDLEKQGRFPKRVSLGDRRVGWVASEVLDYIRSRIEQRDEAAAKRREMT